MTQFVVAPFDELRVAGQALLRRFEVDHRHAELLEVVHALGLAGGGAGGLHGRDQERDQGADDRDHDQEFDEREAARSTRGDDSGSEEDGVDMGRSPGSLFR